MKPKLTDLTPRELTIYTQASLTIYTQASKRAKSVKFKPGQRIVRREMPHDTFTIDRAEKYGGRWYYIMKEKNTFGDNVLGYITGVNKDFIDADSPEGVWLSL